MTSRIVALVCARTASQRLPAKVLADLAGAPLVLRVLERAAQAKTVERVALATTTNAEDDALAEAVRRAGYPVHRGADADVLDRLFRAGRSEGAEWVVRLTGDCPFASGQEVDRLVRCAKQHRWQYASNCYPQATLPDGVDVELASLDILEWAAHAATLPSDREHVMPYLQRHLPPLWWGCLRHVPDYGKWRLTVDEAQDLDVARAIYAALGPAVTWQGAIAWLRGHPEVAARNQSIGRNEGYLRQVREEQGV